jgi:TRAP-type C4-dicarboxylate transport system permease large subunit
MHPIAVGLGYDPLWFGIVAILAIEIGLLTPPFGMVVFAMKSASSSRSPLTRARYSREEA